MTRSVNFFIGTYSRPVPYVKEAKGEGIWSCSLDLELGIIKQTHLYQEEINTTYLVTDGDDHLFVACDNFEEAGAIRSFKIGKDSALLLQDEQSTYGLSTCHVAYDPRTQKIFVSSYINGLLSVHDFKGGPIASDPQLVHYKGKGPNPERQEASHIHQAVVSRDGRYLYTCDLGSDKVWLHELTQGKLRVKAGIATPPGSGPRHLVCHPELPLIYVFCELDASLLTYAIEEVTGMLDLIASNATLPKDFEGQPAGAAIRIHPSNKALYVSNRNHHSISAFSISASGKLGLETIFSINGKEPRDFNIDPSGSWLLCANQDTHQVVPFKLNRETGLPTGDLGEVFSCGSPVCIEFQKSFHQTFK